MAAGDLYVLRHQGGFFGVELENVYHYEQSLGSTGAADLAASFQITVAPSVLSLLSTAYVPSLILVTNLDDPTDFTTLVVGGTGTRTGEGMPAFVGWGFTLFSTDQRVRSGGKRYGGISETDVDSGVASAGVAPNLAAHAVVLDSVLSNPPLTSDWNMILYTPGNIKTLGAPLRVPIGSVDYRRVTTQNTRKTF